MAYKALNIYSHPSQKSLLTLGQVQKLVKLNFNDAY